jgi:hypothetical protein
MESLQDRTTARGEAEDTDRKQNTFHLESSGNHLEGFLTGVK